jgi:hypothetical protein
MIVSLSKVPDGGVLKKKIRKGKQMKFAKLALLFVLGMTQVVGCGYSSEQSDSKRSVRVNYTEEVRLFDIPNASMFITCSSYVQMDLVTKGFVKTAAKLTQMPLGLCPSDEPKELGSFKITGTTESCGSLIYDGVSEDGKEIEIVDHRTRKCKDLVEASIIVTLKEANDMETKLYSSYHFPIVFK